MTGQRKILVDPNPTRQLGELETFEGTLGRPNLKLRLVLGCAWALGCVALAAFNAARGTLKFERCRARDERKGTTAEGNLGGGWGVDRGGSG